MNALCTGLALILLATSLGAQVSRDYATALAQLRQESTLVYETAGTQETWPPGQVRAQVGLVKSAAERFRAKVLVLLQEQERAIALTSPGSRQVPGKAGKPALVYAESEPFRAWSYAVDPELSRLEAYEKIWLELDQAFADLLAQIPPTGPPIAKWLARAALTETFRIAQRFQLAARELVGGDYEWLRDPTPAELAGAELLPQGTWYSTGYAAAPRLVPASLSAHVLVGNSAKAAWDEWGPKWLLRAYDVGGVIEDLVAWRVGDFIVGREGHDAYLNPYGNLTLRRFTAIQCGGQAVQLAWRASETKIPQPWKHADFTIRLEDVSAIDCGVIGEGGAVRASWPVSIFNPGQKLEIVRLVVRTRIAPFNHQGKLYQARGALLIAPGGSGAAGGGFNHYTRTPSALIEDLDVEVWSSDREEVRLWGADSVVLLRPRIVDHGGTGDVDIVDDCKRVEIRDARTALRVEIHTAAQPYGTPSKVHAVKVGETFVWTKP